MHKTGYIIEIGGLSPIWKRTLNSAIKYAESNWCYRDITTVTDIQNNKIVWGYGINDNEKYETFHNDK